MTNLTGRQILDAMRDALEETSRKLANGELDRTGTLSAVKPASRQSPAMENKTAVKSPTRN